jgi:uncharacterized protein DUF5995
VADPSPAPATLAEVIARLDALVAAAYQQRSRAGYFACLYRQVTKRVEAGIAAGEFDDGPRMETLAVTFAARYLAAYQAWSASAPTTRSWTMTFDATQRWSPLILQHLLLGMNAHINLDLGIAAATTAPGDRLPGLANDFNRINDILGALSAQVRTDVEKVSPWIRWVDSIDPQTEGVVITFALDRARANAWTVACRLATMGPLQWTAEVDVLDSWTAILGNLILHPGGLLEHALLRIVRARESSNVQKVMDVLGAVREGDK